MHIINCKLVELELRIQLKKIHLFWFIRPQNTPGNTTTTYGSASAANQQYMQQYQQYQQYLAAWQGYQHQHQQQLQQQQYYQHYQHYQPYGQTTYQQPMVCFTKSRECVLPSNNVQKKISALYWLKMSAFSCNTRAKL